MRSFLVIAMFVGAAACGGKKGGGNTTPEPDNGGGEVTKPTSSTMLPPEKIDEIQRLFQRRGDSVSRCLTFAIDNKELPKNSKGRVTLGVTISTGGKADSIKILKSSIESKSLNDCVVGKVKEIVFPEIPKPYETTYTYTFEAS